MPPMIDMIPLTAETVPMVMDIMNGKYPHAISMYVRHYGNQSHCTDALLTEVSSQGFVVTYRSDADTATCSLDFLAVPGETPITCSTIGDARRVFVEMARHAAEKLGEHIDLPPPSNAPISPGPNDQAAMMAMMSMLMAKGKGKGNGKGGKDASSDQTEEIARMMAMLMAKGEGKGGEPDAAGAPPEAASSNVHTLHGSGGSSSDPMAAMMAIMKGKGKGAAAPADPWANTGSGHRLDGGSTSPAAAPELAAPDLAELSALIRPVDPDAPTLTLRIRLPDRKQVSVTFNGCHTVAQIRAFLQVNHPDAFAGPYHLMDTGNFPPKKLADIAQTLNDAGIKSGASLDCRKG